MKPSAKLALYLSVPTLPKGNTESNYKVFLCHIEPLEWLRPVASQLFPPCWRICKIHYQENFPLKPFSILCHPFPSHRSLCKPCHILFQCVVQALDLKPHQILGFQLMLLWKHQKQGESDLEWEGQGLRCSCWGCHSCFTRIDKHCWWTQQPGRSVGASHRS